MSLPDSDNTVVAPESLQMDADSGQDFVSISGHTFLPTDAMLQSSFPWAASCCDAACQVEYLKSDIQKLTDDLREERRKHSIVLLNYEDLEKLYDNMISRLVTAEREVKKLRKRLAETDRSTTGLLRPLSLPCTPPVFCERKDQEVPQMTYNL